MSYPSIVGIKEGGGPVVGGGKPGGGTVMGNPVKCKKWDRKHSENKTDVHE